MSGFSRTSGFRPERPSYSSTAPCGSADSTGTTTPSTLTRRTCTHPSPAAIRTTPSRTSIVPGATPPVPSPVAAA